MARPARTKDTAWLDNYIPEVPPENRRYKNNHLLPENIALRKSRERYAEIQEARRLKEEAPLR